MTIKAESDLYDVFIDTNPHIDGHFSTNFFDLKAGESITTTLKPVDRIMDIGNIELSVKTLNDIYTRHTSIDH